MREKTLRPARWIRTLVILVASGFVFGSVVAFVQLGATPISFGVAICAVVAVAAIFETLTCRVVLSDEALRVAKLWSNRQYAKSEIQSVTWDAGCGVSLKLATGGWAKLPEVGPSSQGTVNTIRAWLKPTPSHSREQQAGEQGLAANDRRDDNE